MKLVVLGATGGTGMEIVRQAIEQGHSVTAFVRSPEKLKQFEGQIAVTPGNLLDSTEMEAVLTGQEAVLSGFGPRLPISKADADLLQRFARVLTGAMTGAGVKRVVVESTAFLFRDAVMPPTYLLGRLLFPGVVADATAMEQIFRESRLDWTIVRPTELSHKPYTGKYRVRVGHLPVFGFRVSRADVADCFLKAVADQTTIGKVLGISH